MCLKSRLSFKQLSFQHRINKPLFPFGIPLYDGLALNIKPLLIVKESGHQINDLNTDQQCPPPHA